MKPLELVVHLLPARKGCLLIEPPVVAPAELRKCLRAHMLQPAQMPGPTWRVVLDTCAGAGAIPTVPILSALGVEVEGLHLEPTGRFPRDPGKGRPTLDARR